MTSINSTISNTKIILQVVPVPSQVVVLLSIATHIDIDTKVLILSELGIWLLRSPRRLAVAIVC